MSGASEALGERIRAAREARGMSLSQVADQIRIRAVYLAAIEDEKWSAIGVPVYVRGFLRTYARFLGLDPEEAVAAFNRTLPAAPPAPQEALPRRAMSSGWASSLLLWIAGSVAVLLIAFVVFTELTMPRGTPIPTAAASAAPAPATAVPPPPALATPSPPSGVDGPKSLALVLSAPSWLRVTVDGNVSMEGTFPAGTSKTFHGRSALVRIGNAGGVEIYVDGKDFGKLGKSGDVVDRAFTL
ncbi:MAG TPA: helix-turn-helix domain-containing protein [Candidatus Cybelea sp.]|jgi:transcriptional regulator with XRE-family HTH domain|nr:helix-turn-helix domain-containing protein [Candidatus Cybelea sp.]